MAEAPKPICNAQSNPRRAPSLMMVTLTGPTGTESMKPDAKPVTAAIRKWWPYISTGGRAAVLLVLFFDFVADLARDARADESVEQVHGEHQRQDDGQDQPAQNHQGGNKNDDDNGFGEGAPRPQIQ